MAISLKTHTGVTSGLGPLTTAGIDTHGTSLIILAMAVEATYATTPTDSAGNTWTKLTDYTQGPLEIQLWYTTPTLFRTSHTFTLAGSGTVIGSVLAAAFYGVRRTTPFGQQTGANAGPVSSLQPGTLTPSQNNCLIWSHLGINATGTPMSIDSSFTFLAEGDFGAGTNYGAAFAFKIQNMAAAENPTWTRTNSESMVVTQATFLPAQQPTARQSRLRPSIFTPGRAM